MTARHTGLDERRTDPQIRCMARSVEQSLPERRNSADRRGGERRLLMRLVSVERRAGPDRRTGGDRRRRERVGDQIRMALELLARLAKRGSLDDERRRDLDTAMLRLRFALERLERRDGDAARGSGDAT